MLSQSPDCAALFGTESTRAHGWDPGVVLGNLFSGRTDLGGLGYGPFVVTTASYAVTTPTIKDFSFAVAININSVAFPALDIRERGLTLLHELGHAYNLLALRGSGGSQIRQFDVIPQIQEANEILVWTKCAVVKAKGQ